MSLGGNMATSNDGITWIQQTPPFSSYIAWGLAYSATQKMFIAAIGNSVSINNMYSTTDGVTWTARSGTLFNSIYGGVCVSYGNGLWVAGGNGTVNTLAYSTNGITWTGRGTTVFTSGGACGAVAYANNLWVASGTGGNCIATSLDGITWTGRNTTFFGSGYTGQGSVIYHSVLGLWIVGGQPNTYCIVTSPDGITWTGRVTSALAGMCYAFAYSPTVIIAGCRDVNSMLYSTNGITWSAHPSPPVTGYFVQSIVYNAISQLWVCGIYQQQLIYYSSNGFTWTARSGTISGNYGCALALRI
jgi:hypothetical protein